MFTGVFFYISLIDYSWEKASIPIPFEDVRLLAALGNCSCVALPPASMQSSLTPLTYSMETGIDDFYS